MDIKAKKRSGVPPTMVCVLDVYRNRDLVFIIVFLVSHVSSPSLPRYYKTAQPA